MMEAETDLYTKVACCKSYTYSYNKYVCFLVGVWNLVCHISGGADIESVWDQRSNRQLYKSVRRSVLRKLHSQPSVVYNWGGQIKQDQTDRDHSAHWRSKKE
jgi:hypothetical protein